MFRKRRGRDGTIRPTMSLFTIKSGVLKMIRGI